MSTPNNTTTTKFVPSKKLKITATTTMGTTTNPSTDINADGNDDFEVVKKYLLNCPFVASVHDSPAIKAAIEGIEKEQKRRIRDEKLRSKFGGGVKSSSSTEETKSSSITSNSMKNSSSSCMNDEEIVVVEKDDVDAIVVVADPATAADSVIVDAPEISSSSNSNEDMEWQDVQQQQKDEDAMVPSVSAIGDSFTMGDDGDGACFLGRTLARACIDAIAEQQQKQRNHRPVVVSTPLVAIAVALHASLRSEILGFACTGIPDDTKKKKGKSIGFAPSVRELPKTEFLPRGWDTSSSCNPVPLRYRKTDTGAVVLTVEGHPSNDDHNAPGAAGTNVGAGDIECRVTFVPANSKEDSTHPALTFTLSEHINLDSWNAATLQARKTAPSTSTTRQHHKIAPSLHYKNLSGLLSKFCRAFDLGAVQSVSVENDEAIEAGKGVVRAKIVGNYRSSNSSSTMETSGVFPKTYPANSMDRSAMESREPGYSVPSTLDEAFPPHPGVAAVRRINDPTTRTEDLLPNRGDFADDLLPASSGLRDPRFGRVGGRVGGSGNLMGPNHPIFSPGGDFGGIHFPAGPGTMQPRYDPVMPPGIGGNDLLPPGQSRRPRGRHNPGDPNPDHLPPPNSLGDNMFM
jgi:hypothetical protein